MRKDKIFTWMNYRNFRLGQDGNTTFRNFHWRATDKSSLRISLPNKLFIRLLSLHCSMNGWAQTKQKRLLRASKIHFSCHFPNSLLKWRLLCILPAKRLWHATNTLSVRMIYWFINEACPTSLRTGICSGTETRKTALTLPYLLKAIRIKRWICFTKMPKVPAKACFRMSRSAQWRINSILLP